MKWEFNVTVSTLNKVYILSRLQEEMLYSSSLAISLILLFYSLSPIILCHSTMYAEKTKQKHVLMQSDKFKQIAH